MTKLASATLMLLAVLAAFALGQNSAPKSNEERIELLEKRVTKLESDVIRHIREKGAVELRPAR
jgi:hypothetical protein